MVILDKLNSFWQRVVAVLTIAVSVVMLLAAIVSAWTLLRPGTIRIDQIQIQGELSKQFSAEYAGQRLADEVREILEQSVAENDGAVKEEWRNADIIVPGAGVSVDDFVSAIEAIWRKQNTSVRGAIKKADGDNLNLVLWIQSREDRIRSVHKGSLVEDIVAAGAERIVNVHEPVVLAAYHMRNDDHEKAEHEDAHDEDAVHDDETHDGDVASDA